MIQLQRMSTQLPVAILAALGMLALMVSLPQWLLDLLLSANLAFSLAVFILALVIAEPRKLHGFPGLLVASSLVRVVLVLAVARNILVGGTGGSLVVGLGALGGQVGWLAGIVVVLVVALIDLLVISSGMVRVSEVLARFALDALPGRQMAVDAAVADGRLNAEQAEERVRQIDTECAFYGAMDGAARFLRGDCIATLITITATPVAAFCIHRLSGDTTELQSYVRLATGHGLAILLPAIMVGGAGALVLARGNSDTIFGAEIARELMVHPMAVAAACLVLLVTAFASPPARLPLAAMAVGLTAAGVAFHRRVARQPKASDTKSNPSEQLNRIEVGLGLTHLVESEKFEPMLAQMRTSIHRRLGLSLSPFAVVDSEELDMDRMTVVVNGQAVGLHPIRLGRLLAVGAQPWEFPEAPLARCGARILGAWIAPEREQRALERGLKALQPEDALLWIIEETLMATAHEIFDLEQAAELLARAEQSHEQAVTAARARGVDVVAIRRIGAALLAEGIGLHDPVGLLQAVAEVIADQLDEADMTRAVRKRLARSICQAAAPDGVVHALQLAPEVSDELAASYHDGRLAIPLERGAQWLELLTEYGTESYRRQYPITVLCDATLRPAVNTLIADSGQSLLAVAFDELRPDCEIEYLDTVTDAELRMRVESTTQIEER
ncbi:MAG: hypothetical protein GX358_00670 [candidate division WS1 bacterium]|nr:hypothetical protein [candidate division WS1 bacterium]